MNRWSVFFLSASNSSLHICSIEMNADQQLPNESQPRGLTSDFMQLFLSISALNGGDSIGHTCN